MANLEDLDAYLSSDESPKNCMMISDLDGFLHGIACSPVTIPAKEWMEASLGGPAESIPKWVLEAVSTIFMNIVEGLTNQPPVVEPIFWQAREGHVIAMDWCEGFMDAVKLRPKEWLRLTESGIGGHFMTPIMVHLLDENGNSVMGIPQEELDQALADAAEAIPSSVASIHGFWRQS